MNVGFDFVLKRSSRKSLLIAVLEDGQVQVTAPKRMSQNLVKAYLKKKEAWVQKKVREHIARESRVVERKFVSGETVRVFGKAYKIRFGDIGEKVDVEEGVVRVRDDISAGDECREALEDYLKEKARRYFKKAVDVYEERMGTKASRVWLSSAERRWGSCNHKNGLNLNWRLVMAPKSVIHSVIVHELAHTIKKDHSKEFWDIVFIHYPNYKKAKAWLKENEGTLRWR